MAAEYSKDHTAAFWKQFADKYKAKTGITLDVQVVSWDSIDQQSSTMIQNNNAPDILNLNDYASYAKDGLLYNADEVLPASVQSDLIDSFKTSGTFNGKLYGMPDLSSARALFYNKDLFTKAGIAAPPKTWDEFEADAKKVQALGNGNIGYAMPLGPGGVPGRVLHLGLQQRWRLEDRRQVGHQLGQERRDPDLPEEARHRGQGHPEQPGQDQPHRRCLPAVHLGQGRHDRRVRAAVEPTRQGQEGRLRHRADAEQHRR